MVFTQVSTCNYHGACPEKKYTTHTVIHVCEEYSATLTAVLSKKKRCYLGHRKRHPQVRVIFGIHDLILTLKSLVCFYTLINSDIKVNRKAKCKNVI